MEKKEVKFQLGQFNLDVKKIPLNVIDPDDNENIRIHIRSEKPKEAVKYAVSKLGYNPNQVRAVAGGIRIYTKKTDRRVKLNKVKTVMVEDPNKAKTNQRLSFLNTGKFAFKTILKPALATAEA